MSWTGFTPATPLNLNRQEEREITENFLTTPCIRCNNKNHSCLNCNNNNGTARSDGFFGKLSAGKKQMANKLIENLKKKHAANPEDLIFKGSKENNAPQKKAPVVHGKQTGTGSSNLKATSANEASGSHPTSNVAQASATTSSGDSGQAFNYSFGYERKEITQKAPPSAEAHTVVSCSPERKPSDTDLSKLKGQKLDYPTRIEFGDHGKSSKVLTNHFQLTCNPDKPITLYEYKIPELETKGKKKARAMMSSIIASCPVLTAHRRSFATDYFYTIVAWTELGQHLQAANHTMTVTRTYQLLDTSDGPINLEFIRQVDMLDLFRYAKMDLTLPNIDVEYLTRLFNMIVSDGAEQSNVGTVTGAGNKYYRKDAHVRLGAGPSLCTHRGYSYSVRAGAGAVLLNVGTLTSAFWCPIMLDRTLDDTQTWGEGDWGPFEGYIIGLRVYITYERGDKKANPDAWKKLNSFEGRIKEISGIGNTPENQYFSLEGGARISVKKHYEDNYGETFIRRSDLPVINLGKRNDPKWYPAEKLQVLAYQKFKGLPPSRLSSNMLETACKRPENTKALVGVEGLETLGVNNINNAVSSLPFCNLFELRPALLQVDAYRLEYPIISYEDPKKPREVDETGRWNLIKVRPYQHNQNIRFEAIVVHAQHFGFDIEAIINNLAGWSQFYRVASVTRGLPPVELDNSAEKMQKALAQSTSAVNMAVLVLNGKNPALYQAFKDQCDRKYGLHAICLARPKECIKVNLKAAGINHTIHGGIEMSDKLILGADVTHPGPGSIPGCPSIAAIVGSVDKHAGRFLGSMRLQKDPRTEIIDEVEVMVRERILDWIDEMTGRNKMYKTLPNEIYYYRDGISDSQYAQVKSRELPAIRRAWNWVITDLQKNKKLDPKQANHVPKLLAVICGKRHHVRFYPASKREADCYENCHPGTVVDDLVTSPYYQDFYLQSHAALKGTARPCHYFVIENEPKISMPELRQFTHKLCYTYVRSTTGVSYASPAYYADRLCERGRCYLRDFFVAPKDQPVRDEFNELKNGEEKDRADKRTARFGKRDWKVPKSAALAEQEAKDKKEVDEMCQKKIMQNTREAFYQYAQDGGKGNPWHKSLNKTMFWM